MIEHCHGQKERVYTGSDFGAEELSEEEVGGLWEAGNIDYICPATPCRAGSTFTTSTRRRTGLMRSNWRWRWREPSTLRFSSKAWRRSIARHEALRSNFVYLAGSGLRQMIYKRRAGG